MFSDFFNRNDDSISLRQFKNKTLKLCNNGECYMVLRDVADAASFLIRTILDDDPEIECIKVNFEDEFNDFFLISDYLNRKLIRFTVDNISFLKHASEFFQISSLMFKIKEFERHYQIMTNDINIVTLETFESIIFSLNENNYENIAENMMNFSFVDADDTDLESDFETIGSIILTNALHNYLSAPLLFKFAKLLKNEKITNTIINLAYHIKENSVQNYIFQILDDISISSKTKFINCRDDIVFKRIYGNEDLIDESDPYFNPDEADKFLLYIQHNTFQIKKEIEDYEMRKKASSEDREEENEDDQKAQKKSFLNFFSNSSEKAAKRKFIDTCIELRRKGVNPSLICTSIRNDDIELFQKICSSDNQFNFGQKVPFTRFESSSMLIQCSIAEYAAFFGSLKCFRHILINYNNSSTFSEGESKISKYAIAGGNVEIIRLCEQSGCPFSTSALKSCIKFRNTDIFEWLIMNKAKLYGMNMGCTANITGRHYVKQPWFECETCRINSPYGICLYCANHCHRDHRLINRGMSNAFCDCGIIREGRRFCKGMAKVVCRGEGQARDEDKKTETENRNRNRNRQINDDEEEEFEDWFLFGMNNKNADEDEADWGPVNDILSRGYRSYSMVKHLENVCLCQIDVLISTCVKCHNYAALRRLVELGANLIETYPKFFTMAAAANNVRLARVAINLGKAEWSSKYVVDSEPLIMEGLNSSKQIKKLGAEAVKKEIIYVENSCNIC